MIARMIQGCISGRARLKSTGLQKVAVPTLIVMPGRMQFRAAYQNGRVQNPPACNGCSSDADHDDGAAGLGPHLKIGAFETRQLERAKANRDAWADAVQCRISGRARSQPAGLQKL